MISCKKKQTQKSLVSMYYSVKKNSHHLVNCLVSCHSKFHIYYCAAQKVLKLKSIQAILCQIWPIYGYVFGKLINFRRALLKILHYLRFYCVILIILVLGCVTLLRYCISVFEIYRANAVNWVTQLSISHRF